jgi:uncharacterized protein DUF4350
MSRRSSILVGALFVFLVGLGAWLLGGRMAAEASSLNRGARGLLAARLYLEASGAKVTLIDQPLKRAPEDRVLVIAFPWQRLSPTEDLGALDRHLRKGGTLVIAYSGETLAFGESVVLGALAIGTQETRKGAPLHPLRWRTWASEEWTLQPEPEIPLAEPLLVSALFRVPRAPAGARILYRSPNGDPVVFEYRRGPGRVVVLPAEVLANARLRASGNANLLAGLRADLGDAWAFDEHHHGFVAAATQDDVHHQRVLDLYLIHLGFLYVLAVLAVCRRFGPSVLERAWVAGSAGAFLRGLGVLHRRLGHERGAARLLLARAQELDPRLSFPPGLKREADKAHPNLLDLARRVALTQSHGARRP